MSPVDIQTTLRSIASLLSVESQKESTTAVANRNQEIAGYFLKHHDSSRFTLELPSMSLTSATAISTSKSKTASLDRTLISSNNYNNRLLGQLIRRGNPYPPKTSYAKGKKKLQKRRRSSATRQLSAAASTVQTSLAHRVDIDEEMKKNFANVFTLNVDKGTPEEKENGDGVDGNNNTGSAANVSATRDEEVKEKKNEITFQIKQGMLGTALQK